jgi:hypothetical protein
MLDTANFGYAPGFAGFNQGGGGSMVAADGTLSLAGVSEAVKRVLQGQAQQINQLQQQGGAQTNGDAQGQQGGGGGGQGSGTMLTMQARVGEYTAALQQGTSMMSSLADTHRSVAQNTK